MQTLDVLAGDHISRAAANAVELAQQTQDTVSFEFNGITLEATTSSSPESIVEAYDAIRRREMEDYKRSPQYAEDQRRAAAALARDQRGADRLLNALPALVRREDDLVAWVGEFAAVSQHSGLRYDRGALATILKSAGYERNAYVGSPDVHTSRHAEAAWLIGQAIDNLESGMPIHPVAEHFAKEYAKG